MRTFVAKQRSSTTPSPSAPALMPTLERHISAQQENPLSNAGTAPHSVSVDPLSISSGNDRAASNVPIQRMPTIGSPNDKYEREAERAAEEVIGTPASTVSNMFPSAQGRNAHSYVSETGSGRLDKETREFFEQRFGHDFSQVRIHADGQAAEAARALNARAFTVGSHIVFGSGEYARGTTKGRRLMAHELAHVVQQSGSIHTNMGLSSLSTPIIQRQLTATGDTTGFAALVNSIITTQYRLSVSSTGVVSLVSTNVQGPPTREAQALINVLKRIIGDSNLTTIAFIRGATSSDPIDQQVMIGSYAAARIDLDDLEQLGSGEGISAASALAHELVEQYRRQVFSEDYPTAHAAGMGEEASVTGARRGASTRRNIDANSYEIEVAYHYPDRTVYVTRVVRNQNIVAVRRRTTRP